MIRPPPRREATPAGRCQVMEASRRRRDSRRRPPFHRRHTEPAAPEPAPAGGRRGKLHGSGVEREQHLTLCVLPIDTAGGVHRVGGLVLLRERRRSFDACWSRRKGAPLAFVGGVNVSAHPTRTTTHPLQCHHAERRYGNAIAAASREEAAVKERNVPEFSRAANVDAAPGEGVEQGELIPGGQEENAVVAVAYAPRAIVVHAREQEVAATNGSFEIAVGAYLGTVEGAEGVAIGAHQAHEAPEERWPRMRGAKPAEEFVGSGQAAQPIAG